MIVSVKIEPMSYLYTILLTAASCFGSIWALGRKTGKVNMVEALKDNRE